MGRNAGGVAAKKIQYDQEADTLYIQFAEVHPDDNIDIEDGVTADMDSDGHIVGIEVLDTAKSFWNRSAPQSQYREDAAGEGDRLSPNPPKDGLGDSP